MSFIFLAKHQVSLAMHAPQYVLLVHFATCHSIQPFILSNVCWSCGNGWTWIVGNDGLRENDTWLEERLLVEVSFLACDDDT
jgi:hypothetical protein